MTATGHIWEGSGHGHGPHGEAHAPSRWEQVAIDAVGNVIEFWGFKRNQGRVWALLYLRDLPLSAQRIESELALSKGGVSMLLRDLERWGVVIRVREPGSSAWHYRAEVDLFRMVARVIEEREASFVERVRVDLSHARRLAETGGASSVSLARLDKMISLANASEKAIRLFLKTAKLDLGHMLAALRERPEELNVLGAIVAGLIAASPAPAPAQPFVWPVPRGWRSEAFSFPLDFAPEIHHTGTEALRFMPGMFKAGQPDFWSYDFVWWLDGDVSWTPRALEHDLEAYFAGLAHAVDARGFAASKTTVHARILSRASRGGGRPVLLATVASFDPFATHAPITLNVRMRVQTCSGHTAALFEVSSKSTHVEPWPALEAAVGQFRCPSAR